MALIFFLIGLSGAVELLVHTNPIRTRFGSAILGGIAVVAVLACTILAVLHMPNLFGVFLAGASIYRLFNIGRIIKARMHEKHLKQVTFVTSSWLLFAQLAILGVWAAWESMYITTYGIWATLILLQLGLLGVFLRVVFGHARRMHRAAGLEAVHDKDLPSLTVAIPARNETEELHDCIRSLLASHYPKLEILVLDDCSQTARTPEIIRGFAHDGVRFIQGAEPEDNWLAKNQAYERLAETASGEILLFCGVDIRFDPASLRQLVGYMMQKKKDMVCVMPHNVLYSGSLPLIQPMRYTWELALPRKSLAQPPVLSSCWLIAKDALTAAGGFKAASRMVVPEAYFAKRLVGNDSYSFVTSGSTFGVTSIKDVLSQRNTAVRVSYPQIHRRPEMVGFITAGFMAWVGVPFGVLAAAMTAQVHVLLFVTTLLSIAASCIMYAVVLRLAYGKAHLLQVASFPFAALVYVALLNYSMYKYEFSQVVWKGRNVCVPVMHVIPHLPKV